MKLKLILILSTLLITQVSFAQKKSRADRFFQKGDYKNASITYEEELNQEGYTKHILQNIATSYYNTFQFKKAYRYLKVLTSGKFYEKDKAYDPAYDFMMYQVLSALGNYDKAVGYLATYLSDNGADAFNKMEVIAEIEAFKLKEDDYTIAESFLNTDASEFGAVKLDSMLYFTSDRGSSILPGKEYKWTHRSFLDIYQVKMDDQHTAIGEIEKIASEINSSLHEGNFCFTADGQRIYFSKNYTKKGKKQLDSLGNTPVHLYTSTKVDGIWQKAERLPFNNAQYSIEHPSLNADGTLLYVASNRPGGMGDFDIYTVAVNADGTYGTPQNLGKTINTLNREQFPFISNKGHLFFSSNGHFGLGMMDVFVSEFKSEEFSKPINLGVPINSSYDDFSLTYYNETDGFFASNRKNKTDDDIYTFEQTGEIFLKECLVKFEVRDFAKDSVIKDATTKLSDEKKVFHEKTEPSGTFEMMLFPGRYQIKASANGYAEKTKTITVKEKETQTLIIYLDPISENSQDKNPKEILITEIDAPITKASDDINIQKEVIGEALRKQLLSDKVGPPVIEKEGRLFFELPPIFFNYNKWNIRSDSKKVLDEFALKLEKYNSLHIKISSHTDNRGTYEYNQTLSEKRAKSTRDYLSLIGYVNARRMKFKGFGESQPLLECEGKNCTEEEHQSNRRSEFEIVKY